MLKPLILTIGPIHLPVFFFFILAAFIIGAFIYWHYAKEFIAEEAIFDFIFTFLFFSLIMGRLSYIVFHPEVFSGNILRMVHTFNFPGFSYKWGLLLGCLISVLLLVKKKIRMFLILDIFSLAISLSMIFGEAGCFFQGCIKSYPIYSKILPKNIQPLSLYEALASLLLFFLLIRVFNRVKAEKDPSNRNKQYQKEGLITIIFLIYQGISLYLLEFLRTDSVYLGKLEINKAWDIIIFILGIVLLILFNRRKILEKIKNKSNKLF